MSGKRHTHRLFVRCLMKISVPQMGYLHTSFWLGEVLSCPPNTGYCHCYWLYTRTGWQVSIAEDTAYFG